MRNQTPLSSPAESAYARKSKSLELPARSVPLDDSWDVIVIGGGPAGSAAATSAAREGARTLLIELTSCLGGSGTSALVPAWTPFSDQEKIIYGGLAERVFAASKEGVAHVKDQDLDWVPIDAERLKRVYDEMVIQAGVTVLFQTSLAGVETDDEGEVTSILIANKQGLTALKAKVYVDCSGDADLCAWAGASFHKGDELGQMQPGTLCFMLTNVDEHAYVHGPDLGWWNPESPIHAIVASGRYPEIPDKHMCHNMVGPRTVGFNAGHVWDVDNTDPMTVSQGIIKGRRLAHAYREALAEFHPAAFANAFLVATGSVLGIRETRRVIGDYILGADDYLTRRTFEDDICRNCYFIDLHLTKEEARSKGELEAALRFSRYEKGESHGIPYRCLTPQGLKNVLVAGRSISCDRVVQGSVRIMPACLATGEAAGMAAALASKAADVDVHNVDTRILRNRLREEGAYLPTGDRKPEERMATATV